MKLPCCVVMDLLPLHLEDMTNPETAPLLEEHLRSCPTCQKRWEALQAHQSTLAAENVPLDSLRREIRRRRLLAVSFAVCLVCLLLLTAFARLTTPTYLPYSPEHFTITEEENGELTIVLSGEISNYKLSTIHNELGQLCHVLEVWQSPLGQKRATFIRLPEVSTLYYCDNTKGGALIPLWGRTPSSMGTILPRLVLGYYVLAALALSVVLGLLWFLLRKKKAGPILGTAALLPVAYLVSHLLVKGLATTSFHAPRDFFLILLICLSLWGAVLSALRLLAIRRQDRLCA